MRVLIALGLLLGGVHVASADDLQTAKQHYERGTTLYDLQRFIEAAHEYEAAYEAKHDPALLFNIGQAFRFGGDYARAIGAFRSYLRRLPNAENRAEVEQRIAEMQHSVDEQKKLNEKPPGGTLAPPTEPKTETPPPVVTTPPPPQQPPPPIAIRQTPPAPTDHAGRSKRIAGLAAGGAGVVLIVVGGVLEALAHSAYNEINSPAPGYVFNPGTQDTMKTDEAAGYALIGVGAGAVTAGTILFVLGYREGRRPAPVVIAPFFDRTRGGASLSFSF